MDKTITLKDGRTLAYTEHGDPNGKPVFFVHGNPGSRYMRHPDEQLTASLGMRVITPDRPGYGLSDFQPGRTLLDYPDDLVELAYALGIERFYVFGVSAGGPYVAAAAYKLPERVIRASIVSGPAPFDREDPMEGVSESFRIAYKSASQPTWLLRLLLNLQVWNERRNPDKVWRDVLERATEVDRDILLRPEIAEQVRAYRTETVRNGVKGWVQEARLLVSSWGFPLQAVQPHIDLWYGAFDLYTPVQMGEYLRELMPNTTWHYVRAGGHFMFFDHWQDILMTLTGDEPA